MDRSYYQASAAELIVADRAAVLGTLVAKSPFDVDGLQRDAWVYEISHLQSLVSRLPGSHIFLEFTIPRMGRRADAVLLYRGVVFVLEYKVGETTFPLAAVDQTLSYALDLKNFHEESHDRPIVPITVSTAAHAVESFFSQYQDGVAAPLRSCGADLLALVEAGASRWGRGQIDARTWGNGRYKPTPTIVEAAQALYRQHDVQEISRSEAGATNLTATASYIDGVVDRAKRDGRKIACFVTGVPGSGKTLAGLNIANKRMNAHEDEHAVFLSGNGPLVEVLREALPLDALNREKRQQSNFDMSEPEFLLSVMDRHSDWCAVVCLVGEGQEINTGEAGLAAWRLGGLAIVPADFVPALADFSVRKPVWGTSACAGFAQFWEG